MNIFCFSDEQVAVAATDAIRDLARFQQGPVSSSSYFLSS